MSGQPKFLHAKGLRLLGIQVNKPENVTGLLSRNQCNLQTWVSPSVHSSSSSDFFLPDIVCKRLHPHSRLYLDEWTVLGFPLETYKCLEQAPIHVGFNVTFSPKARFVGDHVWLDSYFQTEFLVVENQGGKMNDVRIKDIKHFMGVSKQNMLAKIVCTIRLKRRVSTSEEKDPVPWVIGVTPKNIYLFDQTDVDDKAPIGNEHISDLSEVLSSMTLLKLSRGSWGSSRP